MNRGLMMNPLDNVCILVDGEGAKAGEKIEVGNKIITANADIRVPHKMAIKDIAKGEQIIKYGFSIGYATEDIRKGDWVHIHNMAL